MKGFDPSGLSLSNTVMLGILKLKASLPLHQNLCFDLHSVKTRRQLILSLSLLVLGIARNKVEFSKESHTHTNSVPWKNKSNTTTFA
jgi:hypothetical protein